MTIISLVTHTRLQFHLATFDVCRLESRVELLHLSHSFFTFLFGFNRQIQIEATLWAPGMDGNLTVWLVKPVDAYTQVIPTFGTGAVDIFGGG